jgi:hypothetical protein
MTTLKPPSDSFTTLPVARKSSALSPRTTAHALLLLSLDDDDDDDDAGRRNQHFLLLFLEAFDHLKTTKPRTSDDDDKALISTTTRLLSLPTTIPNARLSRLPLSARGRASGLDRCRGSRATLRRCVVDALLQKKKKKSALNCRRTAFSLNRDRLRWSLQKFSSPGSFVFVSVSRRVERERAEERGRGGGGKS